MRVKADDRCTGCSACASACPKKCIKMESDRNGFLYPVIDDAACVNCGKCAITCPLITHLQKPDDNEAYAAKNKDDSTRITSSSGGLFTLFAEEVLSHGGVVFGAAFDDKYAVGHCYVERIEELGKFKSSKYVQSSIGDCFTQAKDFLKEGRTVLFTGTPCQIGGLLGYLKKPYANLFTQDVVCHGVPSPGIWSEYLNYVRTEYGKDIVGISFKNKENGWKNPFIKIQFKNQKPYFRRISEDLYLQLFQNNLSLRESCYNCSFKGKNHFADFTLADFWGIETVLPEWDDNTGVSLLIINSEKGMNLFERIKENVVYEKVNLPDSVAKNTCYDYSVAKPDRRNDFLNDFKNLSFETTARKFCKTKLISRIKKKIKTLICQ